MNKEKIQNKLGELFAQHRIVFWNDPDRDFEELLPSLGLSNVEILLADTIGQLKTKVILEIENPQGKFLVYSSAPEPQVEADWLLDIRLYSYQFRADAASLIVEELGLQHHQLREHIAKRSKFFGSQQRVEKLKAIIVPGDLEIDIDRKMLAVLAKADNDRFFDLMQALFASFPFEEGLDAQPEAFAAIQKMGLEDAFWDFAGESLGYRSQRPSLRHLLSSLFISDLYSFAGEALSEDVRQFVLPHNFVRDAAVCMSEWRDSVKMAASYDNLSEMIANALEIERYIEDIPVETLRRVATFFTAEKTCASRMKAYVLEHMDTLDQDYVHSFCRCRQEMHWGNKRLGSDLIPRDALWAVYEALIAAAAFIAKKNSYPQGFSYATASDLFAAYTKDLYLFDRLYRVFQEHSDAAKAKGWDVLKELQERMEDMYQNWFLIPMALLWEEKARLDSWHIDGVTRQDDFFGKYPEPKAADKSSTVFVIISDALRYEAGVEVAETLNGRYRFKANMEAMLGCVPSFTALGMAALLPHKSLGFSPKGEILIDGKAGASLEQRSEILNAQKGMAIKSEDLLRLGREEARETVREKNVVYVYHNTIDALGDDAKTEDKAFFAVRKAVEEICDIVFFAVNNLSARRVFVTSDHGFVYRTKHPDDTARNKIVDVGDELIRLNKRFLYGRYIPLIDNAHRANFSQTAGFSAGADMPFAVPKGMSLFNFSGGSRFFHGGMSLQEVVLPVITVEQVRGQEKEKTREKTVGVQVLGQDHRVTTGRHRFEIIQTDAVSDRVKAITYKIGLYAGNEPVSDIQTVVFDSASQEMADRKKEVVLTLKNMAFSNETAYRLVFRDADCKSADIAVPVRIDRVFTTDF